MIDFVLCSYFMENCLYVHDNDVYFFAEGRSDKIDRKPITENVMIGYLFNPEIKNILVLINPVGGAGKARRTWIFLEPHFQRRYKTVQSIETQKPKNAYEIVTAKILDHALPDAIVCLGGDGLLSEIFNALFDNRKLQVPVFPVPTGSGNGLVHSVLASSGRALNFQEAVRAALHGRTQPLDLFQVEIGDRKFVAFLSVTMGLMADADIDSEFLRFCGGIRFTFCGLWKIAKLKAYNTRIKFLAEGHEQWTESTGQFTHVSIFNVSHASADFVAAPERSLNDRLMSAVCVERQSASRSQLVRAMTAAETGAQSKLCPWWQSRAVKAMEITHLDQGNGFVVDGEFVPGETLKASVTAEVAHIYAP